MTSNMALLLGQLIHLVDVNVFDLSKMLKELMQRFVDCIKSICLPQVRVARGALSATLLTKQLTRVALCLKNLSMLLPFFEQTVITTVVYSSFKGAQDAALRLASAEEASYASLPFAPSNHSLGSFCNFTSLPWVYCGFSCTACCRCNARGSRSGECTIEGNVSRNRRHRVG